MKDKVFIDTNIFVYAFLDTDDNIQHAKHLKAVDFLKRFGTDNPVTISTQVLSEYYSALLKNKISDVDIQESVERLVNSIEVVPISIHTVMESYSIKKQISLQLLGFLDCYFCPTKQLHSYIQRRHAT